MLVQGAPGQAPPQVHMLKVRELVAPSLAPEPDEDASEAFLTAALRGNSTRVRRVRRSCAEGSRDASVPCAAFRAHISIHEATSCMRTACMLRTSRPACMPA